MEYTFLLLAFAGLAALGALALICRAYVLFIRSEPTAAGWKYLIGALLVVLLAVPCSLIAFTAHMFIDVHSGVLDWVKALFSWIFVPPLLYHLLYRVVRRFKFFGPYASGYWAKLAFSGVLISWALQALMMYELSTMS